MQPYTFKPSFVTLTFMFYSLEEHIHRFNKGTLDIGNSIVYVMQQPDLPLHSSLLLVHLQRNMGSSDTNT